MPKRLPRRADERMGETLEGEDEEDAGDEIEQRDLVWRTWPRSPLLLLRAPSS